MKKIYLFCSGGMSTSMLASRMQDVAAKNRLPIEIKAFSHSKIEEIVTREHPDCVLLGPQVEHLFQDTIARFQSQGMLIAMINAEDYGCLRGDKVLKEVLLQLQTVTREEGIK